MRKFGSQDFFLRYDLKSIYVPHEQRKKCEGHEVGEIDRPPSKNKEEAQVHGVTGEAVDARGDHGRGRFRCQRINGGLRPAKAPDAGQPIANPTMPMIRANAKRQGSVMVNGE
jgi:hypothetical protein